MNYAPIIIFAFKRLDSLKNTVDSLLSNAEAKDSILYIFVDGAREGHEDEEEKVTAVRAYVKRIDGFKNVIWKFAEKNKGLAESVISGTTEVIDKHGKVIVVEDDLYVSKSFLRYMNEMLDRYEDDERVMQVSGYGSRLAGAKGYPWDAYMNWRAQSWTWGTWKDRWYTIDWKVSDFLQLKASPGMRREFCRRGSDLYGMLRDYMSGKTNSWAIRFCYSMYKQGRYSVCPVRSLVRNDGFTSDAMHCYTYNRYKIDFEEFHEGDFSLPPHIEPDRKLMREAVRYWTIRYRIYGKIRTCFMKLARRKH